MNRYLTLLAVLIAGLVIIFYIASIIPQLLVVLVALAVILVGLGNLLGL